MEQDQKGGNVHHGGVSERTIGALAVVVIFHLASYWFLRKSVVLMSDSSRPKLEFSIALFGLLYWLNPWRIEQSEMYNPAYLFLFSTVHLYTALKMKHKNFWLTFFHVVMIGLCFQTHFSFIILVNIL